MTIERSDKTAQQHRHAVMIFAVGERHTASYLAMIKLIVGRSISAHVAGKYRNGPMRVGCESRTNRVGPSMQTGMGWAHTVDS
jgi:hypothetical protein